MNIKDRKGYKLITINNDSFKNFTSDFEKTHSDLVKNHIIIEISDNLSVNSKDIFILLHYAEEHRINGTTFVVVCKSVNTDDFPENFNIVPTLKEAEDVLEMENIQRDLGF